jgi:hypothetical protein
MAEQTITRKHLLAAGAGTLGALAVPAAVRGAPPAKPAPAPAPAKQQPVYKLVRAGRHTCKACEKHDANSLFPTAKAANGNRAHIGCNCTVVAGTLDYGTFVALFGNPKKLESYRADQRSARNRAVLKNHQPVFPG